MKKNKSRKLLFGMATMASVVAVAAVPAGAEEIETSVKVPEGYNPSDVTVTEAPNGGWLIESKILSDLVPATIAVPYTAMDAELRLKTADGLEPVPHYYDDLLYVTVRKAGELVFTSDYAQFSDIDNSDFRRYIETLAPRGIFNGDQGKFLPKEGMTRAAFAATVHRSLGLNHDAATLYSDVKGDAWYNSMLPSLNGLNLMSGKNGKFDPNAKVTRNEMFETLGKVLAMQGYKVDTDVSSEFKDFNQVSAEAKPYIAALVEIGAVSGYNGMLTPKDTMTRGQMAKVLVTVLTEAGLI